MDRRAAAQNASGEQKGGRPVTSLDAARANDCFELFLNASTLKLILGTYRNICDLLHLKPNRLPFFYPRLKSNLTSWRAKALWKKFDARAGNKAYGKAKLCPNTRVLIIGAGPCGLRTAIEAQLLGAKVVVVEKRDRMSRNNVLHLWPFVIDDLRLLGAKKFFGKFCAGAIDHISIRQLQCILLKVALLLGVEVHTEVSFERLIDPNPEEKTGWRAEFKPDDHPVTQFEFDVIIGADGKRNTLQGFKRKEFRGKLAIAITANFINKRTEAEARVEEISGVAFIFNQKFFKDLYADTGIDLENIVYYKDDTHYFVMTAKKPSLIDKGVIKQDLPDTAKLLAPDNVDRQALMNYAREAAEFSTNYKMLDLEFAVNHYGQADVAMFDFTSMYAAENASKVIERHGYKLLTILVGDSLLEPFWPTGSGCARGFLSSLDAGWAIRAYGSGMLSPLEVIAERESIYRLLAQTTPENLNKDYKSYTLDPSTRYPNLNKNLLLPQQVVALFDTDDPKSVERSRAQLSPPAGITDVPKKRRRRESHVDPDTLLAWIKEQVKEHEDLEVNDVTTSFRDGRVLCAIISHYRPDLLDYGAISFDEPAVNNQLAFDLLEKEIGIPPVMTGEEMLNSEVPDFLTMVSYLTLIYDTFRCEIPHIKHPKLVSEAPTEKPKSRSLLPPPPPPPPPQSDPEMLRPLKSKFSMVARENLGVEELNLTPVKSYEEYVSERSTMQGDNSKSLVVKISISELKQPRFRSVEEFLHRNLTELTKTAYIKESRMLQEKIDAVLDKNPRKTTRLDPTLRGKVVSVALNTSALELPEAGVQTSSRAILALNRTSQTTNFCDCCNVNKQNFGTKLRSDELTVTLEDADHVQRINLRDRVDIPRIFKTLRCGLGIDQVAAAGKTKFDTTGVKSHVGPKLSSLINMSQTESNNLVQAEPSFDRVISWISTSNFDIKNASDSPKTSSVQLDGLTDITSVTRQHHKPHDSRPKEIIVEEVDDVVRFNSDGTNAVCKPGNKGEGASNSAESINKFLEELRNVDSRLTQHFSKLSHCPPTKLYRRKVRSRSEPPGVFSIIVENEENSIAARSSRQPRSNSPPKELPEPKHNETAFTKNHPAIMKASHIATVGGAQPPSAVAAIPPTTVHRPSSRHKRHADVHLQTSVQAKTAATATADRKPRKRKTMEKLSLTNVFLTELTTTILETVVVGLTLFGLDLLINSNSYGLSTLLF